MCSFRTRADNLLAEVEALLTHNNKDARRIEYESIGASWSTARPPGGRHSLVVSSNLDLFCITDVVLLTWLEC